MSESESERVRLREQKLASAGGVAFRAEDQNKAKTQTKDDNASCCARGNSDFQGIL